MKNNNMCSEIMIMWNIYGSRMEEKRIEIWFFFKRFLEMQVTN
jgi:hypothetical protein